MIFENEQIRIKAIENDYDFVATIENKTNEALYVKFPNTKIAPILVVTYTSIVADVDGLAAYEAIKNNQFVIEPYHK